MTHEKVEQLEERIGKENTGKLILLGLLDMLLFLIITFVTFVVFLINLPGGLLLGIAWMIGGVFGSLLTGIVVMRCVSIAQQYLFFSKEERIAIREVHKE